MNQRPQTWDIDIDWRGESIYSAENGRVQGCTLGVLCQLEPQMSTAHHAGSHLLHLATHSTSPPG